MGPVSSTTSNFIIYSIFLCVCGAIPFNFTHYFIIHLKFMTRHPDTIARLPRNRFPKNKIKQYIGLMTKVTHKTYRLLFLKVNRSRQSSFKIASFPGKGPTKSEQNAALLKMCVGDRPILCLIIITFLLPSQIFNKIALGVV